MPDRNSCLFENDHTPFEERLKRKNMTDDKAKEAFRHKPYSMDLRKGSTNEKQKSLYRTDETERV